MAPLPGDRRQEARILAAEVEPALDAEAELARPLLQRLAALRRQLVEAVADLVEVRVARGRERRRERHRLVHVGVPVLEDLLVAAVRPRRRALDRLVGREQALLDRRERGDGLERRAGRIAARDRAVQGRRVRLRPGQLGELPRVDAAGEDRRPVGRVRREREDGAVARVDGDRRTAVRVPVLVLDRALDPERERLLGRALEVDVDRQPDVVARRRELLRLDRALRPAERVDADLRCAGRAAQVGVEGRLDPRLADLVAGAVVVDRVLLLQLLLRDLADVAEDLGGERLALVVAQVGVDDLDPRELRPVLLEVLHARLADGRLDDDRRQRVAPARLDRLRDVRDRDLQQPRQALHHAVTALLGHVGRPELHRRAGHVRDDRPAVAVDDRAARRLHPQRAHLVRLRGDEVAVAGEHLQRPEPEHEHGEDGERDRTEHAHPQRELRCEAVGLGHPWVGREEPARGGAAVAPASQGAAPPPCARPARRSAGRRDRARTRARRAAG